MSQADTPDSLSRLKATIAQLQEVLMTLETEGVDLPGQALDNLAADAAVLVQALQTPIAKPTVTPVATDNWIDGDDEPQPTKPVTQRPVASTKPPTKPAQQVTPRAVRRRQKPWWQQQKVLIGAVGAAIAFVFVWQLTTKQPETTLEANNPDTAAPVETVNPEPTLEPKPETPITTAPVIPQPTVEVKPAPEPPRPLTPEQRLIAAIQAQVDDVTQPYGDNIVRSIEADFERGTLRIVVGDAWYLLKEKLQDRLGVDVLRLAQKLDFTKMRVEDLQGNLVARNPVVGNTLVIMKRYQNFAPEE